MKASKLLGADSRMGVESNHTQYLRKLGIDVWQPRVDASFFPAAPVVDTPQDNCTVIAIDEPVELVTQSQPEIMQEAKVREEAEEKGEPKVDNEQPLEQPEIAAERVFNRHILYQLSGLCSVLIEADPAEKIIPTDQNRVLLGILRSVGLVSQTEPVVSTIESLMDATTAIQHNNNSNIPMFCFSENIQSQMFSSTEDQTKLFFRVTLEKLVSFPNEKIELWKQLKNIEFSM